MKKKCALYGLAALFAAGTILHAAQGTPETAAHEFLQKLVGVWETDWEVVMDPTQPPTKFKGTETVRAIGDRWIVSEIKSDMLGGVPMTGILTLGHDPEKKKFVGTWIDSMSTYLWKYEGALDESGKILTLDTEGPSPMSPGKMAKFRERIELKSKDHRLFTSSLQGENGEWSTFVTVNTRRKS